jgi:hypothetical protein
MHAHDEHQHQPAAGGAAFGRRIWLLGSFFSGYRYGYGWLTFSLFTPGLSVDIGVGGGSTRSSSSWRWVPLSELSGGSSTGTMMTTTMTTKLLVTPGFGR